MKTAAASRLRRERLGLTQTQLAHLLRVSPATVSRWESESSQSSRTMPELVERLLDYMMLQRLTEAKPLAEYLQP